MIEIVIEAINRDIVFLTTWFNSVDWSTCISVLKALGGISLALIIGMIMEG
jgi:hypothetical protein